VKSHEASQLLEQVEAHELEYKSSASTVVSTTDEIWLAWWGEGGHGGIENSYSKWRWVVV